MNVRISLFPYLTYGALLKPGTRLLALTLFFVGSMATTMNAAAGSIDPAFDATDGRVLTNVPSPSSNGTARKLLIQPDGKLVAIDTIISFGNFTLLRYNADGSLDENFGIGGIVSTVFGIQSSTSLSGFLQPDGKIIVVGEARANSTAVGDFAMIRYNTDGSLDLSFGDQGKVFTSFTSNSQDYAVVAALQSDEKIVVSGNTSAGGTGVVRYNSDGSVDLTFGVDGKIIVSGIGSGSVSIQNDGKILLGGSVVVSDPPQETQYLMGLARLNIDGSLDPTFDGDGKVTTAFGNYANCTDVKIQTDGKIVAVGAVSLAPSTGLDFALVRYNSDGSLDEDFEGNGKVSTFFGNYDDKANSVVIQNDGKIVVAGETRVNSDVTNMAVVRYDSNGGLDQSFGTNGKLTTSIAETDSAASIALQSDGMILVSGRAAPVGTFDLVAIVRYDSFGSLDQTFGIKVPGRTTAVVNGVIDEANAIAIQPDGKMITAGRTRVSIRYNFALIRHNPDGTLDKTFGANGIIDTKIGAGDTDSEVHAVAIQGDGKIIAVGRVFDADTPTQQPYFAVARYDPDGSLDQTFNGIGTEIIPAANADNQAYSVVVQPDGKILIAGYNNTSQSGGGTSHDVALVRLNSDGSIDAGFGTDGTVTTDMGSFDIAYSMKLQEDGKIIVAGNGLVPFVARYDTNGVLDKSFGTTGVVFVLLASIRSIELQSDGRILAAGYANVGSQSDFAVARLNIDGALDLGFGNSGKVVTNIRANANDRASTVLVQNDNKIILTGDSTISNNSDLASVRYLTDGSLDVGFGNNGIATVDYGPFGNTGETGTGACLQPDGKLIVAGSIRDSTAIGIAGDRREFLMVRILTKSGTAFDYDADGKSDISIFRSTDGAWYLQQSTVGLYGTLFGYGADKITPADFDGDGKTDIAVYRPDTGIWYVFNSSNGTVTYNIFGLAEDLPTPADYDGDGKADVSVFRPSTATWYRQNSSDGSFYGQQFGLPEDKPTVGDFDGDGKADIAIFRPSLGDWYQFNSSDGSVSGARFGFGTDVIVPADYDGDGKTDIAIFRPSTGIWYIANSSNGEVGYNIFGLADDIPAPGDFDGDGKADVSVFRPSDGTWYRKNSSDGSFFAYQFGANGDKPTHTAYRY